MYFLVANGSFIAQQKQLENSVSLISQSVKNYVKERIMRKSVYNYTGLSYNLHWLATRHVKVLLNMW